LARKTRVSLGVPVKRRGALVATNPSRNSRPELIWTMRRARSSRRVLGLGLECRREEALPPRLG
jgi:hypothetical protein